MPPGYRDAALLMVHFPNSAAPLDAARAWFLLPATWCVWLLGWLVPSLLVAPHLAFVPLWCSRDAAPAAVTAACVLFLTIVWPFWPALAGTMPPRRLRWLAVSVLELLMLLALAGPFVLVAWAVGDRPLEVVPVKLAAAVPALFALGLRVAAGGLGQGAGRWLMLAAMLACAAPLAVAYAAGETMGQGYEYLADFSPVTAAVNAARDGWPADGFGIACLVAWPAVGVVMGIIGLISRRTSSAANNGYVAVPATAKRDSGTHAL